MNNFIVFIIGVFVGIIIASIRKPIFCPKCKTQFQLGKSKRTLHQILWGGWTCQNCGSEIERKGNLIKNKK